MRLWLDDHRPAPWGWYQARTAQGAIYGLKTYDVREISLDHDLGDETKWGNGYMVLEFIERRVAEDPDYRCPIIHIHTANPAARKKMTLAVRSIERLLTVSAAGHTVPVTSRERIRTASASPDKV